MGLTAVGSSVASSTTSLSLLSAPGVGAGGIFLTAVLVYLLAYLNVIEAGGPEQRQLRAFLITASLPLVVVFAGIVAFESLTIIGIL